MGGTSPRVILVMGVSGAGKSTLGEKLASALGFQFIEGDDFHPESNREKLVAGIPLTDEDRAPWLKRLRQEIERKVERSAGVVLACSALKRAYREILLNGLTISTEILFLRLSEELLAKRLGERTGHFVNPGILSSQLETLEEPTDGILLDGSIEGEALCAIALKRIAEAKG